MTFPTKKYCFSILYLLLTLTILQLSCKEKDNCEENCDQKGKITIQVLNSENRNLISGAYVNISGISKSGENVNERLSTSDKGEVTIDICPGEYEVLIDKSGFKYKDINPGRLIIRCNTPSKTSYYIEPITPILEASVNSIDFGSTETTKSIEISNSGIGSLKWSIEENLDWLEIAPLNGTLENLPQSLIVKVNRETLPQGGPYRGTFIVKSEGGGSKSVQVSLTVAPKFSVIPADLNFDKDKTKETFQIILTASGLINFTIQPNQNWIKVIPQSGSISSSSSSSKIIEVEVIRNGLNYGPYSGSILIDGGSNGRETVDVFMQYPDPLAAYLNVQTDIVNFGNNETSKKIVIQNTGGSQLNWNASKSQTWLQVKPTSSGNLNRNESIELSLTVNRANLLPNKYDDIVKVISNGGNKDVQIKMEVSPSNSILDIGLLGYYPFNGDFNDYSSNPNPSTLSGAVPTNDRNNTPESAYYFDGINDFMTIVNPLLNSTPQFTLAFWMKNLSFGSQVSYPLFLRGKSILNIETVNVNGINKLKFGTYFGNGYYSDIWKYAEADIKSNEWIHIVCIYKGNESLEIYVNAELKDRLPITLSDILPDQQTGSSIGCSIYPNGSKSNYWNGFLDDIRIYPRALKDTEIKELYNK